MKRVVIVRHAKSVHTGYDDDFHRNLADRGNDDAEKISLKLNNLNITPELVIASPATRTMQTAAIYCRNLNYDAAKIRQEIDLYEGVSTQDFVELLQQLPEDVQTVFVFGHNPTVYYLVYNLVKYFNSDMPTCSTVALDFEVRTWKDISARIGKVAFQITPKSI
ncbi:MAG: histidine phosphatase family protein [Bacteroidota bacterium]|nr:histidine phosphatase family protein [Bacteroidota bacterium]